MMKHFILPVVTGAVLGCCVSFGAQRDRQTRPVTDRLATAYEVEVVSLGDGRWGAIRYLQGSGQSWLLDESTWIPLAEIRTPAADEGPYVVKAAPTGQGRFRAVRISMATGKLWGLQEHRWLDVPNRGTGENGLPTSPSKKGGGLPAASFEPAVVFLGADRWGVVRYLPKSGASWLLVEGSWIPLEEIRQTTAAEGPYVVKAELTSPGGFGAVRLSITTGKSWKLHERRWVPVAEP